MEVENLFLFGEISLCVPKKLVVVWGNVSLLPSQRTTWQMQHGRSRTVGGSIRPRSVPTPASYCPHLPSFCAIVSVLLLTRTFARRPACCARLLPHTLRLLPQPLRAVLGSFFGTRLSVATLESSFGEQLLGATLRLCSGIGERLL